MVKLRALNWKFLIPRNYHTKRDCFRTKDPFRSTKDIFVGKSKSSELFRNRDFSNQLFCTKLIEKEIVSSTFLAKTFWRAAEIMAERIFCQQKFPWKTVILPRSYLNGAQIAIKGRGTYFWVYYLPIEFVKLQWIMNHTKHIITNSKVLTK